MKMNKKLRRILLTVCSAALLVCVTVGATVAYLTSSATVTNSFVVGKVTIALDEAKVDTAGEYVTDVKNRTTSNKYHLYPAHPYIKDPTIHVDPNSEDCWLFVKVENGIAAIEDDENTIASQMSDNGWVQVSRNVYAYHKENDKKISPAETTNTPVKAGTDVKVFDSFKINKNVIGGPTPTGDDAVVDPNALYLGDYVDAEIKVTAYAIQADGFDSAEAAWTAAGSSF